MQIFPDVNKAEWLAKVEKDLRGKPLAGLDFEVENIPLSPFWTKEDLSTFSYAPIKVHPRRAIGWNFSPKDIDKDENVILKALNHGIGSIYLSSDDERYLNPEVRSKVLKGVMAGMVDVYFQVNGKLGTPNPRASYGDSLTKITCTALARMLFDAYEGLLLPRNRLPTFEVCIGQDYFTTIAQLRALRLCWKRIYELIADGQDGYCMILAHVRTSGAIDENLARIASTTSAMAATFGGANTVVMYPPGKQPATDFSFRVATNIMHLLEFESSIHRVADPASGSYFIESLTDRFAEAIWSELQRIQASKN